LEQASEPVEADKTRVKVHFVKFSIYFREIDLKKHLLKMLNIGIHPHHLNVVVKRKNFLKKHGECPECLLVALQNLDHPSQNEIHPL
jgi:hypothetical protein